MEFAFDMILCHKGGQVDDAIRFWNDWRLPQEEKMDRKKTTSGKILSLIHPLPLVRCTRHHGISDGSQISFAAYTNLSLSL